MGKDWDHGVPGVPFWQAALRVAKPGAFLLAFGSPRTHHRLMVAIEDAGWQLRDCLMFLYGAGFPKSADVSKQLDKAAGMEREVIGSKVGLPGYRNGEPASHTIYGDGLTNGTLASAITAPATDAAKQYAGFGTALKPAWEPIILARKPLTGTIAENVLAWNCGGLNIDACRIGTDDETGRKNKRGPYMSERTWSTSITGPQDSTGHGLGRWPANLILDEQSAAELDEQSGERKSGAIRSDYQRHTNGGNGITFNPMPGVRGPISEASTGGVSRFYYTAKASRADRDEGLEGMEVIVGKRTQAGGDDTRGRPLPVNANFHPTVKPTDLMRWLVRLVTPKGGTILDPFMGSGSTGKAALLECKNFVGIELDPEYFAIAQRRLERAAAQPMLFDVTA